MNEIRGSVATSNALKNLDAINLDVLRSRATQVRGALREAGVERERGDVVGVAAEVQRLGFAIERVQRR